MPKTVFKLSDQPAGDISFNVVPLVDVTVMLVMFFILTTEVASKTYAVLELYRPHQSIAVKVEKGVGDTPNRVIVNILSKDATPSANRQDPTLAAEAKEYQIDGQPIMIGDKETLVRTFRARKADAKSLKFKEEDFSVEIRGDKDVNYMYVAPILRAAAEADIAKMNITALQGAGGV